MKSISIGDKPARTCIITGAGSGIGQATAIELSTNGTYQNLVMIGRVFADLKKTQNMLSGSDGSYLIVHDLGDLSGIPNMVEKIFLKFGRIDCLINIAGYADPQPLLMTSLENMMKTYELNVMAPFLLMRECVKYMKNNKYVTKIINVASTAGITPRPGWLSYASSKAALIAMSSTLSQELAEYKIKVYCVSPGRCATKLRRKLAPEEDQSKIMQPKDAANALCRLAEETEQFLDGQNIIVKK